MTVSLTPSFLPSLRENTGRRPGLSGNACSAAFYAKHPSTITRVIVVKALGGVPAVLALAALGIGLSACGDSGPAKVSVDKVKQAADKAVAAPTTPCPLGLDLDAALKKAGVAATATPGFKGAQDIPAVAIDDTGGNASLKGEDGAAITCTYTLSTGGFLRINVVGVHTGSAFDPLIPRLAMDSKLYDYDSALHFVEQKFDTGKAVVTPLEGRAAVVKLAGDGGDVALEAASFKAGVLEDLGPITGDKLRVLTEALGKQVHL